MGVSALCAGVFEVRIVDEGRLLRVDTGNAAGVVEAVGTDVTNVAPGDHVAMSFVPSCGRCKWCSSGRQYICDLGAKLFDLQMITREPGDVSHRIGDVEAAGTPIILVHGVVDNHTIFSLLRRSLMRRGFGRTISLNYSPLTDDIRRVAKRLNRTIEAVCRETGYERVHVIGHSMGGLIARYYVQRLGGDARVHTLVTLGTPHEGSAYAKLVPHNVARQLRPNSDIVQELREPAPGCRTRIVAVWSDLDQMIVPKRSARIVHDDLNARNVFVRGVGHMSLPLDGRVVHEIVTTLAHLDSDGTTLAPGATSIASSTAKRNPQPKPAPRTSPRSAAGR